MASTDMEANSFEFPLIGSKNTYTNKMCHRNLKYYQLQKSLKSNSELRVGHILNANMPFVPFVRFSGSILSKNDLTLASIQIVLDQHLETVTARSIDVKHEPQAILQIRIHVNHRRVQSRSVRTDRGFELVTANRQIKT
jgi:hypothetical protein